MKTAGGFIVLLTLLWCALWGTANFYVVLSGAAIAFLIAVLVRRSRGEILGLHVRWLQLPRFAFFFLKILVLSNLQVARIVLKPRFSEQPRIVRFDVSDLTPTQITTLATVITLTPGTLSMDISEDAQRLYVHCMSGIDSEAIERDLAEIKRRLKSEVFR